jgi:hypothetical protein
MRAFREFPVEVRSAPPDAHPSRQLSSAPEDRVLGPVMRHSMDVHLRGLPADCDAGWVGGQAAQDAPRRLARTVQDYVAGLVRVNTKHYVDGAHDYGAHCGAACCSR